MGLEKKCLDEKKGQEWEQYNIHSLNQKLSESRDEEMTKYTQRLRTGGSSQRHSVRFLKKWFIIFWVKFVIFNGQ